MGGEKVHATKSSTIRAFVYLQVNWLFLLKFKVSVKGGHSCLGYGVDEKLPCGYYAGLVIDRLKRTCRTQV